MSLDANQGDELVSKLKLDVKALSLLYGSDASLKEIIDRAFTNSGDPDMLRFRGLLQPKRRAGVRGLILISLGEIALASFLTILGIAAFVPSLVGLVTPHQFLVYFSRVVAPSLNSGPLYGGAAVLDFVFASLIMVSAFYTLRQASHNLRDSVAYFETSVR